MNFDLSRIPNFELSTSPEAKVVSHAEMGISNEVSLGTDGILRIGGKPCYLYRHQSQGITQELGVSDIESDVLKMPILNGTVAEILFTNPALIPHDWFRALSLDGNSGGEGGVIFWGTRVQVISGNYAYVKLAIETVHTRFVKPTLGVVLQSRTVGMKATALLAK